MLARSRSVVVLIAALFSSSALAQQPGWWMTEPVRLLQTNLSEKNSATDPQQLVDAVADFGANAYLLNMGGIVAQYPTTAPLHYASPHLPPGRDLFGEALLAAHRRNVRVIGRFDFSKTQQPVYDAHPEWFFRGSDGQPAIYNGLYSACINGGYYHEHAPRILTEALEKYEVDGLFFNMFGNPATDYSGRPMGPCQCRACAEKFQARFGRPIPNDTAGAASAEYRQFLADSAVEVAKKLAEVIHRIRPRAAFFTYIQEHTDGIFSESNTAIDRPLPFWLYSASLNVNRARTSEPEKMAFNLSISAIDHPWRYATVPAAEVQLRLYQNLAHGGPPALTVVGTMNQEDRQSLNAGRPIFQWHVQHEDLYVGQKNAARVLILKGDQEAQRGFVRVLSENHIPWVASDNWRWLDDTSQKFDLVIAPSGDSPQLERYVREGGKLLVAGAGEMMLPVGRKVARREAVQGYWRVQDHQLLPSLRETNLLFLNGPYMEYEPLQRPLLTLIPPAMFGPPEKVWVDKVETQVPGLLLTDLDKGRIACIPWDIGSQYYRHSTPAHANLMLDVIDHLFSHQRQVRTNAHPLVEVTLQRQPARQRTLLHLVNLSGHSDTAYFPPVQMREITLELDEPFTKARAVRLGVPLELTRDQGKVKFTLPMLEEYEVVVLE